MTAAPLVVSPVTEPGVYRMPAADYFADPVPGGSLSSTGARKLVKQAGPARYRYALDHPDETPTSDAFDFGVAAHQRVLGDPDNRLVLVDAKDWRTKAAQEAADAARLLGKTPVLPKQLQVVDAMAAAIAAHPEAAELLRAASGHPEQSLFWKDDSGIWCRARIDWFRSPVKGRRLIIVDYKTCASADDEAFGKSAADFGYHQQDDFYRAGVRALGIDAEPAFVFVAQEKTAPYLVNVIELNETARVIGRNLNRIAINTYLECRETGQWPGYTGIRLVALPAWYERRFDEDSSVIASAAS